LSLADSQQLFFIPEVDLDVLAPEIGLDDVLEGLARICTDEVSGFTIQEPGAFFRPIGQGSDGDQAQGESGPCGAPEKGCEGFYLELVQLTGGKDLKGLPGYRGVFSEGLRGGGEMAILAFTAPLGGGIGLRGIIELGVCPSSTDEGGAIREAFEDCGVSEAAVYGDPEGSFFVGLIGIEGLAQRLEASRTLTA